MAFKLLQFMGCASREDPEAPISRKFVEGDLSNPEAQRKNSPQERESDEPEIERPLADESFAEPTVQQLRRALDRFGAGQLFPWLRQDVGCSCIEDLSDLTIAELERQGLPRQQAQSLKSFADGFASASSAQPGTERSPLTCPEGHVLKRFETDHDQYVCDVCRKKQQLGSCMLGCRLCDHDVCLRCAEPLGVDPSSAGGMTDSILVVCLRADLKLTSRQSQSLLRRALNVAVVDAKWQELRDWKAFGSKSRVLQAADAEELRRTAQQARRLGARVERIEDDACLQKEQGATVAIAIGPVPADAELERLTKTLTPLPEGSARARKALTAANDDSDGSSD
eukprot:TRINITY_DN49204_c0_g1_i1.p1 TRINITY_DN49204_c0_g1~~TRINITY_DN49204_c0_g1_i1.p1  ORF type:complete len:339 (+),score=95.48 TRINITY_DN49204_c0_g1_i1:110-1126(+)